MPIATLKNGIFEKNKARLFTRSNHWEPGIDYNRSFLLIMGLESPRASLHSLDSSTYWLGSSIGEYRVRSPVCPFFSFLHSRYQRSSCHPVWHYITLTLQSPQGGDLLMTPILGRELDITPQRKASVGLCRLRVDGTKS